MEFTVSISCLQNLPWVTSEACTGHDRMWNRSRQTHRWFCLKTRNWIYNSFSFWWARKLFPANTTFIYWFPVTCFTTLLKPCVALNTAWLRRQTCWGLSSPTCLLSLSDLLSLTEGIPHCWRRPSFRVCITGLLQGCRLIRITITWICLVPEFWGNIEMT